ncbi:MAG: zinc-binding dehydrogenase [Chthoniobacterales bacterium]|nr:zinc-binding dehydrogenase [Chthoniobacterales bacterium]
MAMEKTVRAARYHCTGSPAEVLQIDEVACPPPATGEVSIRMRWAPVNPADLNMLEGKYGEARPLPDVPGNEGAGVVTAVGLGVDASWIGKTVLVDREAWREAGNWPAQNLVAVPESLDAHAACVLRVNPPTAFRLLHDFVGLHAGDWIVQNAATSAVGRAVIEIAKHRGWKTLNVVRRPEAAAPLRELGADAVVVDGENMAAEAAALLGGSRPRLGLNAVGGASATRLAGLLAPGGTLATYGAMSKEALKIPNGFLIFRDLCFRGFWLTRWLKTADAAACTSMFGEIFRLAAGGCFRPQIAAEFALEQAKEAVALAAGGTVRGKVLLKLAA